MLKGLLCNCFTSLYHCQFRLREASNLFFHLHLIELKCNGSISRGVLVGSMPDSALSDSLSVPDNLTHSPSNHITVCCKCFMFASRSKIIQQDLGVRDSVGALWDIFTWDCALTLAPLVTSSVTTSAWPASEDMCRAVFPFWITGNKHRNLCKLCDTCCIMCVSLCECWFVLNHPNRNRKLLKIWRVKTWF